MSRIFTHSLKGAAIDLLDVDPKVVDLRDMCEQLAQMNRHNGAFEKRISVAAFTLIAIDCAKEAVKPWVALHKFHAVRLGDDQPGVLDAMTEIASYLGGQFAENVRYSALQLIKMHDVAIHSAAGLAMPTPAQTELIQQAALRAFATERRDFLKEATRWKLSQAEARAQPASKVYTPVSFGKCDFDVGEALYARLVELLPAMAAREAESAAATKVELARPAKGAA